jgi:uncharacterized protein (TIGR00369 family)
VVIDETLPPITYTPPWGEPWTAWTAWANRLQNFTELSLVCSHVDAGSALFTLDESPRSLNPNGSVNGGLVAAAADQAMGLVALTGMPEGSLPATATINGAYLRPAFPPLRFEAAVTQSGRRLVFVTVEVFDRSDRRCVSFTGTLTSQSPER